MGNVTKVDNLADKIVEGLKEFDQEFNEKMKEATDKVAKDTVEELKNTSPKRTGAYAKDWTQKTAFENNRSKRNTVYNRKHYQITHLLEYGHVGRNGKRVKAVPHIKAAEEKAIEEFIKETNSASVNTGKA